MKKLNDLENVYVNENNDPFFYNNGVYTPIPTKEVYEQIGNDCIRPIVLDTDTCVYVNNAGYWVTNIGRVTDGPCTDPSIVDEYLTNYYTSNSDSITVDEAMERLREEFKDTSSSYYKSWHISISMVVLDSLPHYLPSEVSEKLADNVATRFMKLAFDVSDQTSQDEGAPEEELKVPHNASEITPETLENLDRAFKVLAQSINKHINNRDYLVINGNNPDIDNNGLFSLFNKGH